MTWKGVGPLSLQGAASKAGSDAASKPSLRLRVLPLAAADDLRASGRPALLHEEGAREFRAWLGNAPAFLQRDSSDCMLTMDASPCVPRGCVRIEALARHNLHVVTDEAYDFTVWEGPELSEQLGLREVTLEVRVMHHTALLATADAAQGGGVGGASCVRDSGERAGACSPVLTR